MTIALIIVPLIAALLVASARGNNARNFAIIALGLTLVGSIMPFFGPVNEGFLGYFSLDWLPELGIRFRTGADTPGAWLIVLTAFLGLMSAFFTRVDIDRAGAYYAALLSLVGTVIGAFAAVDLVLFYLFFEICLVPAYFLIGIWGGRNRVRAATKFFIYTVVGSLLMLVSIIALHLYCRQYAPPTFDLMQIQGILEAHHMDPGQSALIFGGFAIAFAVKTGLFPFHTWLPEAYGEAPAPVTAFLSGAMAKLGTYGFYRFGILLMPDGAQQWAPLLVTMGVISIIYGALVASAQKDMKQVIAYSSISHLGFVVAGLYSLNNQSLSGAFIQQLNHGITAAALFYAVAVLEERRGTTRLVSLGGLWEQMPAYGRILLILTLSSVALPLTNGFVGEFLILLGTYQKFPMLGVIATTGVIGSAIYMLVMFQKAMYGPVDRAENRRLTDLNLGERLAFAPFIALIFLLGIYPAPVLKTLDSAVQATLHLFPDNTATEPMETPVAMKSEGN